MKDEQQFELSSSCFRLKFNDGNLNAIRPGASFQVPDDSDYIRKGSSFGSVTLTLSTADDEQYLTYNTEDNTTTWSMEEADVNHMVCLAHEDTLPVRVTQTWQLKGEILRMTVNIHNDSDKTVCVKDLALHFASDSDFSWGCNAAAKTIGHYWLASHNSHLLFERCDGRGPILMVLPDENTHLEYFLKSLDNKGSLSAFIHSANARREAVNAGAHIHIPASELVLKSGDTTEYGFRVMWANDRADAREKLCKYGLLDIQVLPGMTVPEDTDAMIAIRGDWQDLKLVLPTGCKLIDTKENGGYAIYTLHFSKLGENSIWLRSGNRSANLEFFVTEPLDTLIEKRGAFIAAHQVKDESKWYDGLLCEWNNETSVQLGPDNYDKIGGWRIYEVTCDDPGLGKPAFLSSKLVEKPNKEEIAAMDRYVERFVWGGLQCTESEPYPYGIYGIPDWHVLRTSDDEDVKGKLHIWRIYDYPHIALTYYNMYRIARLYPDMPLTQSAETYLKRSAQTLSAMFTIPLELDDWSAFVTGLYNELVAEDILTALEKENMPALHRRLERLWNRKAFKFAQRGADVFGSEYPFDTTGFESTHVLAKRALKLAKPGKRMEDREISPEAAAAFMENQMRCNIACRGEMEMAYWWYGSDYRGDNLHYTLSYMSQMGGWSIMDYALYYAKDPFKYLRLGYGSMLSSWALLNTGRDDTNWGWRFPGKQHDGAASGGFEPLYIGKTWLDQPHHGGAWYYSCEIDLGFSGYLRGASTVYAIDPLFGKVCMGGDAVEDNGIITIVPKDGVERRFNFVRNDYKLHLTCDCGRFSKIEIDTAKNELRVWMDMYGVTGTSQVTAEQSVDYWQENETNDSQTQQADKSGAYMFSLKMIEK